jgi:hypothetical protein
MGNMLELGQSLVDMQRKHHHKAEQELSINQESSQVAPIRSEVQLFGYKGLQL